MNKTCQHCGKWSYLTDVMTDKSTKDRLGICSHESTTKDEGIFSKPKSLPPRLTFEKLSCDFWERG